MPPSDNREITAPVEQGFYFFCRAKVSTKEELVARLPHPVFAEAVGVLEMIAKNPDERRLYNARLKMERDERARNLQARLEGQAEGRLQGELMGQVKLLQQLLGDSPSGTDELLSLGMQRLTALEQELRKRLRELSG